MIMTKLVLKSFNKVYFLGKTIFPNKINHSTLQQRNVEKYYTSKMLHSFCNRSSKIYLGTETRSLKKFQLIKGIPKFSTNSAGSNGLMDVKILFYVPFLKKIFHPIQYFRIKEMDSEFDIMDFKESAKYTLELVLKHLSNEHYSDLETLLTPECKNEVEKNVKMMLPEKRLKLAIDGSDIFAEDCLLNTFKGNKGQLFGEVTMIYFLKKDFKGVDSLSKFWEVKDTKENMERSTTNIQVYNCTFIKSFTQDLDNYWKISRVNFLTLSLKNIFRIF